jgi:hypothetical protein
MENKDFIPYQEALALKELGFDEPCFGSWEVEKTNIPTYTHSVTKFYKNSDHPTGKTSAPLYQQAFRWFREKYGLFAEITLWGDGLGYISMIKEIKQEEFIEVYQKAIIDRGLPIWSYEEAESECLKKLIKIVKDDNQRKV